MSVVVITPPEPIVSRDVAKRQLRVEHVDDDMLIDDLLATATAAIDGPGGWLGRALGLQTLELQLDGFRPVSPLVLPFPPVVALVSVESVDLDGTVYTYDPAAYELEAGHILRRVPGASWRATADRQDAVRIRYTAGWPMLPAQGEVPARWSGPAPIRHAIVMMVARLYAQCGEDVPATLVEDRAVQTLLAPWRVWSL